MDISPTMTSNFSNLKTKSKSLEDLPSTTTTKTYKSFYGFKSTRAAIMLSRGTKTSKNFPKKATLQRNFSQSNSQLDGRNDKNEQAQNEQAQNECSFETKTLQMQSM